MAFIHIWAWVPNPDGSDSRDANLAALDALIARFDELLPGNDPGGMLGGKNTYDQALPVHIYVEFDPSRLPPEKVAEIEAELARVYQERFPHLDVEAFLR